jgi:hypothetical protein
MSRTLRGSMVMPHWDTINPRPSSDAEYAFEGIQEDVVLMTPLEDDS